MSNQRTHKYVIRDGVTDPADFLDLYQTVWGERNDEDWFHWLYEANPYVDEVPFVAAELDSELVGTEPCLAFRVGANDETAIAYQPANWMVHPDHRRRGVFSMMTEEVLDRYADGPPAFYFNFPTEAVLPGLAKFGWRQVDSTQTYVRIQNPERVVAEVLSSEKPLARAALPLSRVGTPILRGCLGAIDTIFGLNGGISVRKFDSVPAKMLAALYERSVPDRIHIVRDEPFYRWRFDNPRWDATTYVAWQHDEPVGSVVAISSQNDPGDVTRIFDVLPLDGSASNQVYGALVEAVVSEASDAYVIQCGGEVIPGSVLRRCGFWANDTFPFSKFSQKELMVVRPAARHPEEPYRFAGRDLMDPSQWALDMAGREIV